MHAIHIPLAAALGLIAMATLVPAQKNVGMCQPYAETCPHCTDCTQCGHCAKKGGRCSVCWPR
ncbi:MAG TPA: hypothetical protein DIT13_02465 [Verrucomicrobiales bacterium]|nr:hypothetical protein [Verrucomicrobiales bacterium]HRJ10665.1 hypothetical protein [Prosthecobacter sp.]HRK16529.1 hypothetical protein [Prosthecobacter sp.]